MRTINTSQGLFKVCRLPQGLKNLSLIFQDCIQSTLKVIKGVVIFQDNVSVCGTTKEEFDRRVFAVRVDYMRNTLLLKRKKFNSKLVDSFLGYHFSNEKNAPHPKHNVEKTQKHQLTTNNSNRFLGKLIFTEECFLILKQNATFK